MNFIDRGSVGLEFINAVGTFLYHISHIDYQPCIFLDKFNIKSSMVGC